MGPPPGGARQACPLAALLGRRRKLARLRGLWPVGGRTRPSLHIIGLLAGEAPMWHLSVLCSLSRSTGGSDSSRLCAAGITWPWAQAFDNHPSNLPEIWHVCSRLKELINYKSHGAEPFKSQFKKQAKYIKFARFDIKIEFLTIQIW